MISGCPTDLPCTVRAMPISPCTADMFRRGSPSVWSSWAQRFREAILYHYGPAAFLSRLSDPFWFQAFGAVMGMDWHSSGITTSVMGALKTGLNPRAHELGIYICGGRGRHSRNTPDELRACCRPQTGADGEALVRTSRLTARIDNNAIADGFQIYLHTFILTREGEWAVVQQGMNERKRPGPALSLALRRTCAISPPSRTPASSARVRARS